MTPSVRKIKLAHSRGVIELKGGFHLTNSIKIKPNRIQFDYNELEIVNESKWRKKNYCYSNKKKSRKVIGNSFNLNIIIIIITWDYNIVILLYY